LPYARPGDIVLGRRSGQKMAFAMKRAGADTLRLVPDPDVAIELDAGARDAVWLRLEPVELIARHRWIRLRYSASFFDDPVRPLIRFKTRAGATFVQAMNGPVLGSAEWMGRVPDDTVKVSISPGRAGAPTTFRIDDVSPLSRIGLLRRGLPHDWRWVYWTARSRLLNSRQEAWQALKFASPPTPLRDYGAWRKRVARSFDPEGLDRGHADWNLTPRFRFLLRASDQDGASATIASLQAQAYPKWTLDVISTDVGAPDLAGCPAVAGDERVSFMGPRPDWTEIARWNTADDRIGVLDAGDVLPNYALAVLADRLAGSPSLAVVYSDEDTLEADGTHRDPIFKPCWSPCLQARAPYVGRLALVRAGALDPGGDALAALFDDDRMVIDRILAGIAPAAVGHVRRVLYHRRAGRPRSATAPPRRSGPTGNEPTWPPVGIVIPTRDRADLLSECVRGLKDKTDYPAYEIVVVDNGSTAPDAIALLRDLKRDARFKVVERPGPFNFSALSNDGANATAAPVLAFVNNDIVVVDGGWLKPLVRFAVMPQIGVVGAKLLFPDGRLQHAGVVLGFGGIAGHLYRRMPADHAGYCNRLTVAHEVGAVTAACIAVERYKFEAVGGFDAENLPVDLNDMDLCLRISERGWTNLWTPESVLIHLQSATRGIDPDPFVLYRQERTYFVRRWAEKIRDDPYFHPALSLFAHEVALP
jgi:O-antigen biosynthesis protein